MTLAIDPGSRILGWCVLDGDVLVAYGEISTKRQSYADRFHVIIWELDRIRQRYGITEVACERAFRMPKRNTSALQVVVSCIKDWARESHLKFSLYSPSEWKRSVTGSGRATKELVGRCACLFYPELEEASEHVCDAVGIGMHAQGMRRIEAMAEVLQ